MPPSLPYNRLCSKSAEREPDRPCLAYRETVDGVLQPYKHLTYTQCAEKAAQVGSAYTALGLTAGDRVGICGGNSPEWMLSMQVIAANAGASAGTWHVLTMQIAHMHLPVWLSHCLLLASMKCRTKHAAGSCMCGIIALHSWSAALNCVVRALILIQYLLLQPCLLDFCWFAPSLCFQCSPTVAMVMLDRVATA